MLAVRTDNQAEVGTHVFERAGLGRAPFRVVTFYEGKDSCAYCGQGIVNVCVVADRGGRQFSVGCDCVRKTGDAGLIVSYKNSPEVRAARRAKAQAKDAKVVAEFNALMALPGTVAKLSDRMVKGRPWVPGEQVTMLDSFKRQFGMSGAKGHASLLKALKFQLSN
jgi:hypothetical protein